MNASPAIEITSLFKSYKKHTALQGLNMTVETGDLYGFVGANGAGKTTTLKILATLLYPTSGSVRVLGHDIEKGAQDIRKCIGYMPDFFGVYQDMEAWEYLDFFGAVYRMETPQRDRRVADVLELVGLTQKREALIGSLSRGMQQRLGLARVLMHDPELLLLDEPASGLDPRARIEVMAVLQELQKMGKTILISSHILPELQQLCNKVGIIEKGRLVYSGPISGLPRNGSAILTGECSIVERIDEAIQTLQADARFQEVERSDDLIRFKLAPEQTDISIVPEILVQRGFKIRSFKETGSGLEDVFMNLTSSEISDEPNPPPILPQTQSET
jgi:ABC-2 type transport system ATP-binding protein